MDGTTTYTKRGIGGRPECKVTIFDDGTVRLRFADPSHLHLMADVLVAGVLAARLDEPHRSRIVGIAKALNRALARHDKGEPTD